MTFAARSRSSRSLCSILTAIIYLTASAGAHVQLSNPVPINSPENPNTNYQTAEYDYTSPLSPDGSDFPCKGFQNTKPQPVAEYQAGDTYNATLSGSATHMGGSCQFALSYDEGKSFKVIKSMIGGCPLKDSYDFTIPSEAPSGTALFAWTWLNYEGNREFYMDCAWVTIDGSSSDTTAALSDLPNIFVANLNGVNQCTTKEQENPVFADPGPVVEYGDGLSASSPVTNDGQDCTVPSGGQSSDYSSSPSKPMVMAPGAAKAAASSAYSDPPSAATAAPMVMAENHGSMHPVVVNAYDLADYTTSAGDMSDDITVTVDTTIPCSTDDAVYVTITTSCSTASDMIVTITAPTVTVKPTGSSLRMYCSAGSHPEWRYGSQTCVPNSSSWSRTMQTLPSSRPWQPPASSTMQTQNPPSSGTTPPYAVDTAQFMPCVPGTFLCTSAKEFLTCDQAYINGAYGWTWLYPRAVASGMMCKANLVAGVGKGQQPGAPSGYHREDQYVREGS